MRAAWEQDGTTHEVTVRAGEGLPIPKDVWHTFTTLEPGTTAWCVFVLRDATGAPVTEWDGGRFWYFALLSKQG